MAHDHKAAHFRGLTKEAEESRQASRGLPANTNPKDDKLLGEQLQAKRLPGVKDAW